LPEGDIFRVEVQGRVGVRAQAVLDGDPGLIGEGPQRPVEGEPPGQGNNLRWRLGTRLSGGGGRLVRGEKTEEKGRRNPHPEQGRELESTRHRIAPAGKGDDTADDKDEGAEEQQRATRPVDTGGKATGPAGLLQRAP